MKRLKRSYLLAVMLVAALGVGLPGCGGGDGGRKGYESEADTIPYAELVNDPAAFEGSKVKFHGQVVKVVRRDTYTVEGGSDSGKIILLEEFYLHVGKPLPRKTMKQLRQQHGDDLGQKFHIVLVHWAVPEAANFKPGQTVTVLGEMYEELYGELVPQGSLGEVPEVKPGYVDSFKSTVELP